MTIKNARSGVEMARTLRDSGRTTCNLEEAALVLGIGRSHAYKYVETAEFPVPVIKMGNRYLVPIHPLLKCVGFPNAE